MKAAKYFSAIVVGAFVFMLALAAPGTGSAEAYVKYDNTKSNTTNYTNYSKSSSYNKGTTSYNNAKKSNTTIYNNYQKAGNTTAYNNYQKPTYTTPAKPSYNTGTTNTSSGVNTADEQAMLNKINQERAAAGLNPLTMDEQLTQIARMKAQDMIDNNYFDHNSPTYGSPFDMMKNNGVTYHYAGENLAGAPDVNTAHANLMNSPGHRANILKPEYTEVGIGVVSGGPYGKMFVQEFNG